MYEIPLVETITNEQAGAMIGWFSSAVMCSLYFSQQYYSQFNNLVGRFAKGKSLYAYGKDGWDANLYTAWGVGQTVNIWLNIITNLVSVILVSLAGIHGWELVHMSIMWAGLLRYLHGARIVFVGICKIISLFSSGMNTSYMSYSGFNKNYKVSIEHPLYFMDFIMEWGQFAAIYGLFPTLHQSLDTFEEAVRIKQHQQKAGKSVWTKADENNDEL
jgi:hypothetical protein